MTDPVLDRAARILPMAVDDLRQANDDDIHAQYARYNAWVRDEIERTGKSPFITFDDWRRIQKAQLLKEQGK